MFQVRHPLCFGFVLLLAALPLGAQIPAGLTAYWDFDNNLTDKAEGPSGTASSVADHLAFSGTAAGYTNTGKFGSAYTNPSGGNGHAEAADSVDVDESGDAISVSAWLRVGDFDRAWQAFVVKGEGDSWRLHRPVASNTLAWYGGAPEIYATGSNLNDGNWHHLVATQDPGLGARLYIDGALVASGPASPIADNANPLMIGENPDVDGRNWRGDIDDVGIWNRALSATEVTQLWNGGTGTPISSFLASVDNDNDGLPRSWELVNELDDDDNGSINPDNGPGGDPDGDGLNNVEEYRNNTLANNPDTDGDGFGDGHELAEGSNPTDRASRPLGLILHYTFDVQNGAVAANEIGMDGTMSGGGSYVSSQTGYGLAFQGNRSGPNTAKVGTNQSALELALGGNAYTAMAWVYWAGASGGVDQMVFGMGSGVLDQLHHGIRADENPNVDNLHFGHWGGDIGNAGGILPNTWTHLTWSFDGDEGKVFINGVESATQALIPLAAEARGHEVVIGFTGIGGAGSFNGAIDEVKVFNLALSAAEIAEQMVPPAPPVANHDSITMHHDGKVRFDVAANDSGGIKRSTVQIVSAPASGSATAMPDGTVLYKHTNGTPPTDTFVYQIGNLALDDSDTATVTVSFTSDFRFDTSYSKMPPTPPATALVVEDAFEGLTFDSPHDFNPVPGDPNKLFVAEGDGRVWLVPDVTAAPTDADKILILDVTGRTDHNGNEKAFKGIAPHPDWENNGYLYVTYNSTSGTSRLSRFTCQTTFPFTANPTSEQILIDQTDTGEFHNIGTCEFGADRYLYASFGDEGTQGDGYSNSQYIDKNMWCSIIRLDVDKKPGSLI
ncbi:MAG: LamG-like jellyroll fold domain-containing protein, partial [Verrucomicrobiales bacterium]